jgi:hypothetical protein
VELAFGCILRNLHGNSGTGRRCGLWVFDVNHPDDSSAVFFRVSYILGTFQCFGLGNAPLIWLLLVIAAITRLLLALPRSKWFGEGINMRNPPIRNIGSITSTSSPRTD